MPLIKDGAYAEDQWSRVKEGEAVGDTGAAIVSLGRWLEDRETLAARNAPIGLRLEAGESPEPIADDAQHFGVIELDFPAFKDGRAYSWARMLRQNYGYKGELRATGEVLRSQLLFMHRVGFNAFEVDDRITPEILAEELARFQHRYQPSADGEKTVIDERGEG